MNAKDKKRLERITREKLQRARELIAYMDLTGITIGWTLEGYTTFHPMSDCAPKLIQEATILSKEIKALKEGRIK